MVALKRRRDRLPFNRTFRDNNVAHSSHWIDNIVAVLFMRKFVLDYMCCEVRCWRPQPLPYWLPMRMQLCVMGSNAIINDIKVVRLEFNELGRAARPPHKLTSQFRYNRCEIRSYVAIDILSVSQPILRRSHHRLPLCTVISMNKFAPNSFGVSNKLYVWAIKPIANGTTA